IISKSSAGVQPRPLDAHYPPDCTIRLVLEKAYAKPDAPFDQRRRYMIVVTDGVHDATDNPVAADPAFTRSQNVPIRSMESGGGLRHPQGHVCLGLGRAGRSALAA